MGRLAWPVAAGLLGAALLTACGGGGDDSAIAETVEGFYLALSDDPPKAYTYLSEQCKDDIDYFQFATSIDILRGFVGEGEVKARNLDTRPEGDEVVAQFDLLLVSEGEEIPLDVLADEGFRFTKEDGRWRFADCAGFGPSGQSTASPTPAAKAEDDVRLARTRAAEANDDADLPGEFIDLPSIYGGPYPQTADHTTGEIDYSEQGLPPAGGPHWGAGTCSIDPEEIAGACGPVQWGMYRQPFPAESLVHNLEHGGVVVWYRTDDQDLIGELEDVVEERLNRGQRLVMVPYADMAEETVALTAWSRRDAFPAAEYDRRRVERFIDAHERRFNPEGL